MSKPLKVGLVGAGRIAEAHMAAYTEHADRVQLTAVCDIVEDSARKRAKQAGIDAVYTDFETLLKEADVDALDILTRHDQHPYHSIAAMEAGKHVLTEKAMASTLKGCRDMIDAADKAGVTLMVAQNLRYSPDAAAVKRLIDDGELGTVHAARCQIVFPILMGTPAGHWMTDGDLAGGGIGMTNVIHQVDLLRYYIGNVKRVSGFIRTVQPELINGAEDLLCATLEFENGAIGDVFASWTTFRVPESISLIVIGSDGTTHSTPPTPQDIPAAQFGTTMVSCEKRDRKGKSRRAFEAVEPIPGAVPTGNCFINEILHFEECCRESKEPLTSGKDNIETVKVIMGIYESARTGKTIDLDTL